MSKLRRHNGGCSRKALRQNFPSQKEENRMTDRRDEEHERREDEERRQAERERRSDELKESWRRNHPSKEEDADKNRPRRGRRGPA